MYPSCYNYRTIHSLKQRLTPLLTKTALFVSFKLCNCYLPSRICNSNCSDMGLIATIQTNLHPAVCHCDFCRDGFSTEHLLMGKMFHRFRPSHS